MKILSCCILYCVYVVFMLYFIIYLCCIYVVAEMEKRTALSCLSVLITYLEVHVYK